MNTFRLEPVRWENLRRSPLFTAVLMAAGAWSSMLMSRFSGDISPIWLANGIIFVRLLDFDRKQWPLHLAAAALANSMLGLLGHYPVDISLLSTAGNIAEIAALLFLTGGHFNRDTSRFKISASRFTLTTCGVVAAVCLVGTVTPQFHQSSQPWLTLLNMFCGDVLGMLLVCAVVGSWRRRSLHRAFAPGRRMGTLFCLAAAVGVTGIVFRQNSLPLIYVLLPVLIYIVFERGISIAVVAVFLQGIVAVFFTMHGYGPITTIASLGTLGHVVYLQVYLTTILSTIYPIGRALHKQQRTEQVYELLASNSRDIITRSNLDGQRLYCSPSSQAVLGWSPEEMVAGNAEGILHPQDVPRYQELLARFREGMPSAVFTYRARTKGGAYIHMEARVRLLREPVTGLPHEVISTSRDVSERIAAEKKLEDAYKGMQRLASIDSLTGLANRRVFDDTLEREWRRAQRDRTPLGLLLLDVDYFKAYNDALGHPAGDACLRRIAHCLADIVQRPGDLAARYGGEEFVALLPMTDAGGAQHIAGRILEALAELAIPHPSSQAATTLTLSVGLASVTPLPGEDPAMLVAAADGALYRAKKDGRARIVVAPAPGVAGMDEPAKRGAEELASASNTDSSAREAVHRRMHSAGSPYGHA